MSNEGINMRLYQSNTYEDKLSHPSTSSMLTQSRTTLSLYKEPETDDCKRCFKYIYPLGE